MLLAANPLLLADLNVVPGGSAISSRIVLGSHVLFVADDGTHGNELWATDTGTGATSLLKDLNSSGSASPLGLTVMNGEVFFLADVGDQGFELWKSNGTSAGTVRVKNVGPAFEGETNLPWTAVSNGQLYFSLASNLWKSDGTEAGTSLLKTFDAAVGSRGTYPRHLTPVGDEVFFVAIDNTGLRQLWKTDGTSAGTELISAVQAGELAAGAGYAFFTATNQSGGQVLWRTDGTSAGTIQLSPTSGVSRLNMHGDKAYFSLADQLWVSDGTEAGTGVLASNVAPLAYQSVGNALYFSGIDNTNDTPGLWMTDGTPTGTQQFSSGITVDAMAAYGDDLIYSTSAVAPGYVAELRRVTSTGATTVLKTIDASARAAERGDSPAVLLVFTELVTVGQQIFVTADDGVLGRELYVSDGTAQGTGLVKDINAGKAFATPSLLTPVVDHLFFLADDGIHGLEPWRSDGTTGGTNLIQDINPHPARIGSDPSEFTQVGELIFFVAETQTSGRELWKTDGSRAATMLAADIAMGDHLQPDLTSGRSGRYVANDSNPASLVGLGDQVYFLADDGSHGREVWTSDGSATQRLAEVVANLTSGEVQQLWKSGEAVYFIVAAGAEHVLWQIRTDGTTSVTLPNSTSLPVGWGVAGGRVVFTTEASNGDPLLWSTNLTPAGTAQLTNNRLSVTGALTLGNKLLLGARSDIIGQSVWTTDGTAAGTTLLVDNIIGVPNAAEIPAQFLAVRNNTGYFLLKGAGGQVALWQSDGSNVEFVTNLAAGSQLLASAAAVANAGHVFFYVTNTQGRLLLMRTDGLAGGTIQLLDLGSDVGASHDLAVNGDLLYFVASDSENGTELWTSDGTIAGTRLAHNIQAAAGSGSSPKHLRVVDDGLLFSADAGLGSEPWFLLDDPWHNLVHPVDVNADDFVVPLDVILVINELNQRNLTDPITGLIVPTTADHDYLDVDRDGYVAPIDALIIISTINNQIAAQAFAVDNLLVAAALDALDTGDDHKKSN